MMVVRMVVMMEVMELSRVLLVDFRMDHVLHRLLILHHRIYGDVLWGGSLWTIHASFGILTGTFMGKNKIRVTHDDKFWISIVRT
jgi:hypothetical protein